MKTLVYTTLFCLVGLLLTPMFSFGQDATEGTFPYMKKETAQGLSIVILGQPNNVEKVVEQLIEAQTKAKAKSEKGMQTFIGAQYSPVSSVELDYYFQFEKPSKKDKEHTRIYMFMREGNGQFVTSVTKSRTVRNAKDWLADLEMAVKVFEMEIVIEDQEKVIEKAMKVQKGMVDDSLSLQRTLVDTMEDIEENKADLSQQKQQVTEESRRLSEFRKRLEALRDERRLAQETRRRIRSAAELQDNK